MIITIDTAKKLTEVEVNLLKVLLGTTVSAKNRAVSEPMPEHLKGDYYKEESSKNRAETVPEATKEVEPKPEVKVEVETPSEASEEQQGEKPVVDLHTIPTLAELKALAQERVKVKDRNAVKAVINKFAPKLTDVKTADYQALWVELEALKG